MRGRKPTPTAILNLTGSRVGSRRRREPEPERGIPSCPPHLDDEAKREWRRLVKILDKANVLTLADRGVLAAYCAAWSRMIRAEAKLAEIGMIIQGVDGSARPNPWHGILVHATKQVQVFGAELGLSPASRPKTRTIQTGTDSVSQFARKREGSA